MLSGIGWTEVLVVLAIVLLLFGGAKLPELARGSGRALRIFKSEVQALGDDDKDESKADSDAAASDEPKSQADAQRSLDSGQTSQRSIDQRRSELG